MIRLRANITGVGERFDIVSGLTTMQEANLIQGGLAEDIAAEGVYPALWRSQDGDMDLLGPAGSVLRFSSKANRVFALGDSITMRQHRSLSGHAVTVNGSDVTIAVSNNYAPPESVVRIINQANSLLNRDVPVISNSSAAFTVRYPFDVTGLFSGTAAYAIYAQGNDTGYINYICGLLAAQGKTSSIERNCGDGGDTIAEMLARVPTELVPLIRPGDIVVVLAGTNDLEITSTAAMISGLKSIYDQLLAAGAIVHAGTITQAQSSARYSAPATALAQIAAVNGYIRARCKSEARMRCFDAHAALGGGDYAAAGTMEAGGVHPLPAGAQLIAARYISDCGADYRKSSAWRWLSTADNYVDAASKNLLTNCEFNGASGATPPTGWTVSGSGTRTWSQETHPDGTGYDLQLIKSHSAAAQTSLSQSITSRVSAGDRLIFGSEMETVSAGEGQYFLMVLEITTNGEIARFNLQNDAFTYANGGRMPASGTRYLHEKASGDNAGRNGILIPNGTTAVSLKYVYQLGESGGFTARVARPFVIKV